MCVLDMILKKSDGEDPVMVEFWRMRSTPQLPLFPDPLYPVVIALDRVLSKGRIELFDIQTECKQMICVTKAILK